MDECWNIMLILKLIFHLYGEISRESGTIEHFSISSHIERACNIAWTLKHCITCFILDNDRTYTVYALVQRLI